MIPLPDDRALIALGIASVVPPWAQLESASDRARKCRRTWWWCYDEGDGTTTQRPFFCKLTDCLSCEWYARHRLLRACDREWRSWDHRYASSAHCSDADLPNLLNAFERQRERVPGLYFAWHRENIHRENVPNVGKFALLGQVQRELPHIGLYVISSADVGGRDWQTTEISADTAMSWAAHAMTMPTPHKFSCSRVLIHPRDHEFQRGHTDARGKRFCEQCGKPVKARRALVSKTEARRPGSARTYLTNAPLKGATIVATEAKVREHVGIPEGDPLVKPADMNDAAYINLLQSMLEESQRGEGEEGAMTE